MISIVLDYGYKETIVRYIIYEHCLL